MKGELKVAMPAEYLAKVGEPRKADIAALDALIRKHAPKLKPFVHSGMLGCGDLLQVCEPAGRQLVPHRTGK